MTRIHLRVGDAVQVLTTAFSYTASWGGVMTIGVIIAGLEILKMCGGPMPATALQQHRRQKPPAVTASA